MSSSPGLLDYVGTKRKGEKGPRTLILDLDETLIHSWERPSFLDEYRIYTDPQISNIFHPLGKFDIAYSISLGLDKPNAVSTSNFTLPSIPISPISPISPPETMCIWGLKRPFLNEFLSFSHDYFDHVLVWSAGIEPYVQEVTRNIFRETGFTSPRLIWSRTNCPNYQGYFHKPISDITALLSRQHPKTFFVNPQNTLILDDKLHTFMQNPLNGVLIPPYHPGMDRPNKIPTLSDLTDRSDTALLKFMTWLDKPEVRNAEDVRSLDKSKIFV